MENIKLSNFRKIKDTWALDLAPITFFTGKNSSGKSSALKGLMILSDYGKTKNHFEIFLMLQSDDFSNFDPLKNGLLNFQKFILDL